MFVRHLSHCCNCFTGQQMLFLICLMFWYYVRTMTSISLIFPPSLFYKLTARRTFNPTKANDQVTIQFTKPRPPAPPRTQVPSPPSTAEAAADTSRPMPALRALQPSLKKPPAKKPSRRAPNCPPPLPPPSQAKEVPSIAQWEKQMLVYGQQKHLFCFYLYTDVSASWICASLFTFF